MSAELAAPRQELAPGGILRVGINHGNPLLVTPGSPHGAPTGIAPELGAELAKRLGVKLAYVSFDTVGATADGGRLGLWDVAFLGAEPQRASEIAFTSAYVELPVTFLVPAGSSIRAMADVDRKGVRIAVAERSAFDLFLTRTIKNATLVRAKGLAGSFELFERTGLEALAGLRPALIAEASRLPDFRILDGQITAVQQAIGTPKARETGAAYLRSFVEDAKRSGLVQELIDRYGIKGINVPNPPEEPG